MSRIFISYAHADRDEALWVYEELLDEGFAPWIDIKDILPGQDWRSAIQKAIQECSHFIVLLSTRSVNRRGYFHAELAKALEMLSEVPKGSPFLIPVRLEDIEPKDDRLARLQRVDLFNDRDQAIENIVISLRRLPESGERFDEYLGKVSRTGSIVSPLARLLKDKSSRPLIFEQATFSTFGILPDITRRPPEDIESGYARLILRQRELLWDLSEDSRVTLRLVLQPFVPERRKNALVVRERLEALRDWMMRVAATGDHIDFVISHERVFNRFLIGDVVCVDGYRAVGADKLTGYPLSRSYYGKDRVKQALAELDQVFSQSKESYPSKKSVLERIEDLIEQCAG